MGQESFARPPVASPEEEERSKTAYAEADPTTYSELPIKGEKIDLGAAAEGYENRLISSNGEKFVKLEGTGDAGQFVTAKLLKGIINVSDVTRDENGDFYSKVMPMDKIQEQTSPTEVDSDFFIIKALTGDGDRDFIPGSENNREVAKNLIHEDGKIAYFDFGNARYLSPETNTAQLAKYTSLESLELAGKKLALLYARLSGTMGTLFLKSIIKESGSSAGEIFSAFKEVEADNDEQILALQATLLKKVQEAQSEIYHRSSALRARAA